MFGPRLLRLESQISRGNQVMGNYKFKVLDLIPKSWVYKLKDMNFIRRKRSHKKEPNSSIDHPLQCPILDLHSHPRKSHNFTRDLAAANSPVEPPQKFSKGKPRLRAATAARSSPRLVPGSSSGCSSSQCSFHSDDNANAIIFQKGNKVDLPPIITRSPEETIAEHGSTCPSVTITKKNKPFPRERSSSPSRRFSVNSPGPKLRIMNSPRASSKRFSHSGRRKSGSSSSAAVSKRSLTDTSLAIVKSTNDPERDFRKSMVEMIVENKISASNELEDLLACYLSLNTHEYHHIIISVFKQIWFDMSDIGIAN